MDEAYFRSALQIIKTGKPNRADKIRLLILAQCLCSNQDLELEDEIPEELLDFFRRVGISVEEIGLKVDVSEDENSLFGKSYGPTTGWIYRVRLTGKQ